MSIPTRYASVADSLDITTVHDMPNYDVAMLYHVSDATTLYHLSNFATLYHVSDAAAVYGMPDETTSCQNFLEVLTHAATAAVHGHLINVPQALTWN